MILGIDGSNLRRGGGITHLIEILGAVQPEASGFSRVIIWSSRKTLDQLEDKPWLEKVSDPALEKSLPFRLWWQRVKLSNELRQTNCDILFVPGGMYLGSFRPFVTMSRNMLPFEFREIRRYGFSWQLIRNLLLKIGQAKSFQSADGVIFLTKYAKESVSKSIGTIKGKQAIIPHGVNRDFSSYPREPLPVSSYNSKSPFSILYVSVVEPYKHQWHVVEAVAMLIKKGLPVKLDLVGPANPSTLIKLEDKLKQYQCYSDYIKYHGAIDYKQLAAVYSKADLFIFASSCENMPNILLEAMSSGLPVASSNLGPMPEILEDAGLFFNPESPLEIKETIEKYFESSELRKEKAVAAYNRALDFSWERCANSTFDFLASTIKGK